MDLKSDFFDFFQTICFWKAESLCFNPISSGILNSRGLRGGAESAPPLKFHLGVSDSISFLYTNKPTSNQPESKFLGHYLKNCRRYRDPKILSRLWEKNGHRHKNVRHSAKCQYFEVQFFANIFILTIETYYKIKIGGYRRSWWVIFPGGFHKKGPEGGTPQKISDFFLIKSYLITVY